MLNFHKKFTRWKGAGPPAGAILIGADGAPTGAPATWEASKGNVLSYQLQSPSGWPIHRVAVGYKTPSATNFGAYGTMFIFDAEADAWFRLGEPRTLLQPNAITFFDTIAAGPRPATNANEGRVTGAGVDVALFIEDPGSVPDGAHVFSLCPDLTLLQESGDDVARQLQAADVIPITPSDTVDLPGGISKGIWMPPAAVAGNIAVIMESGISRIIPVIADKEYIWRVRRVLVTGTTASGFYSYH